jgi:dGTPase
MRQFAEYVMDKLTQSKAFSPTGDHKDKDAANIMQALSQFRDPGASTRDGTSEKLMPMWEFRSAVIRLLARHAGAVFHSQQKSIIEGTASALLRDCAASPLLKALNDFAASCLYSSTIVRNREITAQAVLSGLLDAYLPLMICERNRFDLALLGARQDADGQPIARDSSLAGRISRKYLAVYKETVRQIEKKLTTDPGAFKVMERIYRIRLIVDHISGMTDEFALQTFQLISGAQVNPYRN